jgi:hypothetical protein
MSSSALKTGVWKVQVWLVIRENDREDIAAGGSRLLGPFTWVAEEHKDAFVVEMTKRYGSDHRVQSISVMEREFCPSDTMPTLEEEIAEFETYLADPSSWDV